MFRLLGALEIERNGESVPLGGQRQRALLAVLVLNAGRVVPTDTLVDRLWGEEPPRTAVTSLQNAVGALRRALGADAVETRAPGYVLRVDDDAIDVRRFERLVAGARMLQPAERRDQMRAALDLWRGPPLAEFAFERFAGTEILRLEELRLSAIEERISADLELGSTTELIGELESLVREHPLRERFRSQLMLALYRSGRQAEALETYQAVRETLVDQLGIEPSPELRQLQASILRHEAGLQIGGDVDIDDLEADVMKALLAGRVIPVLGLDGGADLAKQLAAAFDYPRNAPLDLARVSQYVATMNGAGPLYDELHRRFEDAVEPGPLHRFLAALPPLLRDNGAPHQLIVTTRYDLALEQAFVDVGEELDVVTYVATGQQRGRFWHRRPGHEPQPIDVPNTYATELSLDTRTVLLQLHGAVDVLPERLWESFAITEDDFIDYLGRADLAAAVPVSLAARLRRSHFLFLGYEMVDWHLRLVLHRIWGDRPVAYRSWAVQDSPSTLERAFWRRFDVDVVDLDPAGYVGLLGRRLDVAV